MADTTIGYAVLQIIPSLKGVTEAIEKQLAGKTIAVTVEPKVDPAKVDKSVKDAVKKKPVEVQLEPKIDASKIDPSKMGKPPQIPVDPKIDGAKVEQQVKDAVKKAGTAVKSQKLDLPEFDPQAARDIGAKLREKVLKGLQELNNNPALQDIQEQVGEQVGQVIGEKIGEALGNTVIGQWARGAAERVQGVVSTVQAVSDSLLTIKQGDAAGGLNGIADALGRIGQTGAATKLHEFATEVQPLQDKFGSLKTNIEGSANGLLGLTNNSGKIAGGLNAIAGAAGPLAAAFVALDNLMPGFDQHLQNIMRTGGNFKDWVNNLVPGTNLIDQYANNWINPGSTPALPNSPTGPNGLPRPGLTPAGQPPGPPAAGGIPIPGLVPVPNAPAAAAPAPRPQIVPPSGQTPTVGGIPIPGLAIPGRAGGGIAETINGMIRGPGTGTSDSILGVPAMVRVSNGEFLTNEEDTRRNLPLLQAVNAGVPLWDWLRQMPRFDGGGLVAGSEQLRKIISERFGITNIGGWRAPDGFNEHSSGRALDVMVGNDKAKGDAVKDFALANASAIDLKWAIWQQRMWYPGGRTEPMSDRGSPTQNHMDHVHIFSGPGITNGLLGALQGSARGRGDAASTPAGLKNVGDTAAAAAAAADGTIPASSAAGTGGSAGSSSGGFSFPGSLTDMSSFGLDSLGEGVGATQSGSDLSLFGKAAGSAISGQVSSALGAFGVPSTPGWLQGISQFVSGISIGGGSGGGATPVSAAVPAAAPGPAPIPSGAGAGQQQPAGVGAIYNIKTATVEDAFARAQRIERERAAAKLDRF